MRPSEPLYPCPVCLGAQLSKLRVSPEHPFVLDRCERCGGLWLDHPEIAWAQKPRPQAVWAKIVLREEARRMQCHACHTGMDRNALCCPVCEWPNVIDCPVCEKAMQRVSRQGLVLDVCRHCRGVWFDPVELSEIWNLCLDAAAKKCRSEGLEADPIDVMGTFFDVMDLTLMVAETIKMAGAAAEVAVDTLEAIVEIAVGLAS